MTALEQKLLDELELLEQSRAEEQTALQAELEQVHKELETIQEQQKQILEELRKEPENDSLEETLKRGAEFLKKNELS